MKDILKHAIEIEGSRVALAAAMGVAPSVITYWAAKLPRKREAQLVKLYRKRKRSEWTKK